MLKTNVIGDVRRSRTLYAVTGILPLPLLGPGVNRTLLVGRSMVAYKQSKYASLITIMDNYECVLSMCYIIYMYSYSIC